LLSAKQFGSRGSALVKGAAFDDGSQSGKTITTRGDKSELTDIRPMPEVDDWFENVWNEYNRARA